MRSGELRKGDDEMKEIVKGGSFLNTPYRDN